MSTTDERGTGKRLLVVVGVGLLLVLAWVGGRLSGGGALPFDMMSDGTHGNGMMNGGPMYGAEGMQGRKGMPEGGWMGSGDFEGEVGLKRCRAMMGTMTGMHRSMQSMMGEANGEDIESESAGQRSHMGGGMMQGRMGDGMRAMHGRMGGGMEAMSPDEMRSLCRTMHGAMRAAMHEDEVGSSGGTDEGPFEGMSLSEATEQWLRGTRGFASIEDRTGEEEVVVEVGAGDGLQYAPASVRVDPGTTVRWRWTGQGGLHDVAFLNADVRTSLRGDKSAEFTHTFDGWGEYRYECTPHSGIGMRGAIIVGGGR